MHETSTGVLYDIESLGKLTHAKNKLFVVDGISSIGADKFLMDKWHCDCAMVSSNKALACMPGLSFIAFSDKALKIIKKNKRPRYYFDALDCLNNITRGMTPFTPAMNIILQVKEKIKEIKSKGIESYNKQHFELAQYFRELVVKDSDFSLFGDAKSNAMTTIVLPNYMNSKDLIHHFRTNCNTELAPIPLKYTNLVRVSHMGHINKQHMKTFVDQLFNYKAKLNNAK
jgi:aspartate aminotransferase-like enzyme